MSSVRAAIVAVRTRRPLVRILSEQTLPGIVFLIGSNSPTRQSHPSVIAPARQFARSCGLLRHSVLWVGEGIEGGFVRAARIVEPIRPALRVAVAESCGDSSEDPRKDHRSTLVMPYAIAHSRLDLYRRSALTPTCGVGCSNPPPSPMVSRTRYTAMTKCAATGFVDQYPVTGDVVLIRSTPRNRPRRE